MVEAPITIQEMAEALLNRNDLRLRQLVQSWLRSKPNATEARRPTTQDQNTLVVSAALVELLALRLNQKPPTWAETVGGLEQPFFVMKLAERPGFTRDLCLREAPEPLKRRNIFTPPNFLNMV